MIIAFFLLISSIVLEMVRGMFSLVSFVLPVGVTDSVTYFLSYLRYLDFAFPVNTLLLAVGQFILFLSVWYTFKLLIWVIRFIPFLGIAMELPKIDRSLGAGRVNIHNKLAMKKTGSTGEGGWKRTHTWINGKKVKL